MEAFCVKRSEQLIDTMIRHIGKVFICSCCVYLFSNKNLHAQQWAPESNPETKSLFGIAAGVMNYSGFMDKTAFTLKQASFSGELMYRYDVTDNFHIRATGMLGWLQHCNCNVNPDGTPPKNYGSFQTGIAELDVLPEYDFLNMSTNKWHYKHRWSPYIYLGGGLYRLFRYKVSGNPDGATVQEFSANFRGGIGFKYAATPGIQVFIEGDRRELSKSIDFYDSNIRSRYYSIMVGGMFSFQKRMFKKYWLIIQIIILKQHNDFFIMLFFYRIIFLKKQKNNPIFF